MTLVNYETGEIVERDPEEAAAIAMLDQAISALTGALGEMPIEEIVTTKARVSTVQTATRELGMSKEAQELAAEAVRRAEWALGRAIRKGQAEGTVSTRTDNLRNVEVPQRDFDKTRPLDIAPRRELYGNGGDSAPGILAIADAAPTPEQFDAALDAAKAEGNLSRANVARKAREASGPTARRIPRPPAERTLASIQSLAAKAAREAQTLTPEQIRRVKAEAGHITTSLRQSIEALHRLVDSLDN